MLYLSFISKNEPEFLQEILKFNLPDDIIMSLGNKFPDFDAKDFLAKQAELRKLEQKKKKH